MGSLCLILLSWLVFSPCDALAEQVNGQVVVVLDVDTIEVLHDNKPERSG
jgi:hypothetical protein